MSRGRTADVIDLAQVRAERQHAAARHGGEFDLGDMVLGIAIIFGMPAAFWTAVTIAVLRMYRLP
jgi:hypothetical protein